MPPAFHASRRPLATLVAVALTAAAPLLIACGREASSAPARGPADAPTADAPPADARPAEARPDTSWQPLFDGASLAGWQGQRTPGVIPAGWAVVDGAITRVGPGEDLVTVAQYASFVLEFEWMVTPGGNSGVFYRVDPEVEVTYMSAPEYQVLDDAAHRDGASRLTSAGAAYGLYASPAGHTRPVGTWNQGRIVVDGARVEHWLNGTRLLAYELGSPDWEARVRASKFSAWPRYGRAARGRIGLQDHGDRVAFRNLRLAELP
jgi:hypothetical protein